MRYLEESQTTALQQSTTYILPVGTDPVSRYVLTSESRWILRVPWDGCLLRAFGSTFRNLSGLAHTPGSFLGGTARIYAALARGEPNVANFSRLRFIEFSQFSYGQGFTYSVTSTFKKLEPVASLSGAMERALDSTFEFAYREVEQAAQSLRSSCHCDMYSGRSDVSVGGRGSYCIFALALTIRHLVTILSGTDRDDSLLVSIYGLQSYYGPSESSYSSWLQNRDQNRNLVGLAVGLASVTESEHILEPTSEKLLQEIRPLFDGSTHVTGENEPGRIVANASSGICCYRECLHGISSEAAATRIIHIIPGHIERGTAQYDVVDD